MVDLKYLSMPRKAVRLLGKGLSADGCPSVAPGIVKHRPPPCGPDPPAGRARPAILSATPRPLGYTEATASISTSQSGSARLVTTASVLAGR